jgi:hypothetical protein
MKIVNLGCDTKTSSWPQIINGNRSIPSACDYTAALAKRLVPSLTGFSHVVLFKSDG